MLRSASNVKHLILGYFATNERSEYPIIDEAKIQAIINDKCKIKWDLVDAINGGRRKSISGIKYEDFQEEDLPIYKNEVHLYTFLKEIIKEYTNKGFEFMIGRAQRIEQLILPLFISDNYKTKITNKVTFRKEGKMLILQMGPKNNDSNTNGSLAEHVIKGNSDKTCVIGNEDVYKVIDIQHPGDFHIICTKQIDAFEDNGMEIEIKSSRKERTRENEMKKDENNMSISQLIKTCIKTVYLADISNILHLTLEEDGEWFITKAKKMSFSNNSCWDKDWDYWIKKARAEISPILKNVYNCIMENDAISGTIEVGNDCTDFDIKGKYLRIFDENGGHRGIWKYDSHNCNLIFYTPIECDVSDLDDEMEDDDVPGSVKKKETEDHLVPDTKRRQKGRGEEKSSKQSSKPISTSSRRISKQDKPRSQKTSKKRRTPSDDSYPYRHPS